MFKIILFSALTITFSITTQATTYTEEYSSVARDKKGQATYQEQHKVIIKDRKVQKASTQYLDPSGKVIGEMVSDFTKAITIPDYEYKDLRHGISHGIRLNEDKITLWHKTKDGKTEEADFSKNRFSQDTLIVGCQGLHYYLIENLEQVKQKKSIPIAYFMPGKLDYYKFTLKVDREDEEYIYLKLSIDSFILKLFTSSLDLKYNKSDRRLVQFTGLSNITNEEDQLQNVVINYTYK